MPEVWAFWNSPPEDPPRNMAWDAWLLSSAAARGIPVFRSYRWRQPAATFGYFQRYAEIARITELRPLLRRPTGGGLVRHDGDWTYALAIPPGHPWHALTAVESYQRIHGWIAGAFSSVGWPVTLADCCRKEAPGQCFAGHEKFDVLRLGTKLAGAAQRRNKSGLLIQGSIRPPEGLARQDWEESMRRRAEQAWSVSWARFEPNAEDDAGAEQQVATRYGLSAYHEMR
ncbi:MAG: hypothetical protein FJ404_17130 [Verrucomicrobia bacterium]|nr:hypothetical protein [Verrucomicrobiota bacterium]